jgi:hypothetical protein
MWTRSLRLQARTKGLESFRFSLKTASSGAVFLCAEKGGAEVLVEGVSAWGRCGDVVGTLWLQKMGANPPGGKGAEFLLWL